MSMMKSSRSVLIKGLVVVGVVYIEVDGDDPAACGKVSFTSLCITD